ncbi:MAG: GGDEF domain-containing protein, partial [Lachnospiraceae bacterium]|nr:GGDEF domain-containing protein [Lachnospiraceae bacterium]
MLDIDYFTQVNDALGPAAGDDYLKKFADLLRNSCDQHLVFRYCGDEFCILFNGITLEEATTLCRRIYRDSARILDPKSIGGRVAAASYGLSVFEKDISPDELIRRADQAMYAMKKRLR